MAVPLNPPAVPRDRVAVLLAAALVAIAALAAYANSFRAPFLLDDAAAIVDNASIRRLGRLSDVLVPPTDATTAGRPLLNLSWALDWAAHGDAVVGYHVVNFAVHLGSAWLLLALVRRLVIAAPAVRLPPRAALAVALFAALGWALHPIVTEAVTYLSQRAESLMGCLYLGTLYAVVRSRTDGRSGGWQAVAVASCAAGMAVKEVMVTAPLVALLLDRSFFGRTFGEVLRQRCWLYAGLAATWLLLGLLMYGAQLNTWTDGTVEGVTWWSYAATEAAVVLRYVKLATWPAQLVFDYGTGVYVTRVASLMPQVVAMLALIVGAIWFWRRNPALGFAPMAVLLILSPTSSVVPIAIQPMAESRMYLPLAVLVTAMVALWMKTCGGRVVSALTLAVLAGGTLTVARNADYASELRIWSDSVAKFPGNARSRSNLGLAWTKTPGGERRAREEFEAAIRLNPRLAEAHFNLANLIGRNPDSAEAALREYDAALQARPGYVQALNNRGLLLARAGRTGEAIEAFAAAVNGAPANAEFHSNYATALAQAGRASEAERQFRQAVALAPERASLHFNLGNALLAEGRDAEAAQCLQRAVALQPDFVEAHNNLAAAWLRLGRNAEALAALENAAQLRPNDAALQENVRRLRGAVGH